MLDIKADFRGGLNLDDALYNVQKNAYVDALNITRDAIEGSNDEALTNIVGNQLVDFPKIDISTEIINRTTSQAGISFIPYYFLPGTDISITIYDNILSQYVSISDYTTVFGDTEASIIDGIRNASNSLPNIYYPSDTEIFTIQYLTSRYSDVQVQIVDNTGKKVCIGSYANTIRNTIIYCLWNESGYHSVLEYNNDTRTISPIFINLVDSDHIDILGFEENKKITSINVYPRNSDLGEGDLLFFLDGLGRPTTMDILRFKLKEYFPIDRDMIDVCKMPPLSPPESIYINDSTRNVNGLRNRLFRFKYRYVYNNNERSVCSPISKISYPLHILDNNYESIPSNNNAILLSIHSGHKTIKSIELLMSYVHKTNIWSDFSLVENIDRASLLFSSNVYTYLDTTTSLNHSQITFSGYPAIGAVITIYGTTYSRPHLVALSTYTIINNDTIASICTALILNFVPNSSISYSLFYGGGGTVVTGIELVYNSPPSPFAWINIACPIVDNNVEPIFNYKFYNDSTYPLIDVNESIQLFDYVPEIANAQEMPNGNVLLYGGITEGYDNDLIPNVINDIRTAPITGVNVGSLTATIEIIDYGAYENGAIRFYGFPAIGTKIDVYFRNLSNNNVLLGASYTTVSGDTPLSIVTALVYYTGHILQNPYDIFYFTENGSFTFYYITQAPYGAPYVHHVFDHITISTADSSNLYDPKPTFLFSTRRSLGIAYFDKKGKTNGIVYSGGLEFPPYAENASYEVLAPYINTKIYHQPPIWAHSFNFYMTKESTQFLYWVTSGVAEDANPDGYIYFNISNIDINQKEFPTKAAVLNWQFQDGDRVRLLKEAKPASFNPLLFGINYDAELLGVIVNPKKEDGTTLTGSFAKIKKNLIFDAVDYTYGFFVIQFYRPEQQLPSGTNQVYYEFGEQFAVGDAGLPTRYHFGNYNNQFQIQPNTLNITYAFPLGVSDVIYFAFTGTPVPYYIIDINITNNITGIQTKIASYTITKTDTIASILTNLVSLLQNAIGTFISAASVYGTNNVVIDFYDFTYNFNANPYSLTATNSSLIPAEFNFYRGDVYYSVRKIINAQTPAAGYSIYNCIDRNFVDNYISAVNDIDGRPSVIEVNAKRAYYSTLVRFSEAYQPNTNLNGTNRFYPNNFDEYDYSFGDIMRFKVRDRFVRVFQKLKVGKVPLYNQILKEQNKETLVVTDRLLNPIMYYIGDVGIGENAESLASYNFADYFTSNVKGMICKATDDGIKFISIDHKVDSWAWKAISQRTGNYKIYGAFDQILGNYIIALEATPTDPAQTLVFDGNGHAFDTFLSYHPENMTTLGVLFVSFKDGGLYTHDSSVYNNFYGIQYDSTVTFVFNQNPLDKKTFLAISETASQIWDAPEIKTDINSYGTTKMQSNLVDSDFAELEGSFEATILRDENSQGGLLEGDSMKGKLMTMKFRAKNPTSLVSLNLVSLRHINSPLNNR